MQPGDLVLCGMPGISMPRDWFLARVLLVDGDAVATIHGEDKIGGPFHQFQSIDNIRARGTIAELCEFRNACAREVEALTKAVHEAESALGRARDAVWARLDAIAVVR